MSERETIQQQLSHSLKNHICTILSVIDVVLMEEDSNFDEFTKSMLVEIRNSANAMTPMVKQLKEEVDKRS